MPASPHCGDSQHSVASADIRRKAFRRRYEFFVERSTYETQQLHEDTFLKILWDESPDAIGIDWKEATSSMTGEEFKKELTLFADRVEAKKAHGILVDVARFRHKPGPDMQEWRVKNISGRYYSAGVRRFAFLFPERAPIPPMMNQSSPGGSFATRGFNDKQEAIA